MWPGFVHLGPKPLRTFLHRSINSSDQPPQSLHGKKKWQTLTRRKGLETLVVFGIVWVFFGNEEEINIFKPHDVGVEFPRIWDGLGWSLLLREMKKKKCLYLNFKAYVMFQGCLLMYRISETVNANVTLLAVAKLIRKNECKSN